MKVEERKRIESPESVVARAFEAARAVSFVQPPPRFTLDARRRFVLLEDYVYRCPWNPLQFVVIPKGYRTNFASIPALARWLVSPIDPHIVVGALVHDWLVQEFPFETDRLTAVPWLYERASDDDVRVARKRLDWADAAWYMRAIMAAEEAPSWKRFVVYAGVRLYGWVADK